MASSSAETARNIRWNILRNFKRELDESYKQFETDQTKHENLKEKARKTGKFICYLKSLDETSLTADAIIALQDVHEESLLAVRSLESSMAGLEGKISMLEKIVNPED